MTKWSSVAPTCCAWETAAAKGSRLTYAVPPAVLPALTAVKPVSAPRPAGAGAATLPKKARSMRLLMSRASPSPTTWAAAGDVSSAASRLMVVIPATFLGTTMVSAITMSEMTIS